MDLRGLRASADQAYAAVTAPGAAAGTSLQGWVELLSQVQETVNVLHAVQTVALVQVAAIEDVELSDGTVVEQHRGLGHRRLDAPSLVAGRLGMSEQAAGQRLSCAVSLVTRTPALVSAMASGALDGFRASVVGDELDDAPADVAAEVVERLGEHLRLETAGPLRRRTRRILGSVAPMVLARRAATVRARRGLHRSVEALGLDHWRGWYPTERSRTAWAAVDALAQGYLRDGRAQTIDQARADAHMDLLLAQVTATVHLHATVPAAAIESATRPPRRSDTEACPDAGPHTDDPLVEVGGLGTAGTSYVSLSWLGGAATDAGTPLICHPRTGAALTGETGVGRQATAPAQPTPVANRPPSPARPRLASGSYRPPPSIQLLVRLRDGHCRFPGCVVSVRFCDIDHVVAWPTGPSSPDNLMCLCRRHHRVKQRARWSVSIDPDGTVTWRDPTGHTTTTTPVDHLHSVPPGRTVEVVRTDQPARPGVPLTSGTDEWSLLDDVLLRRLLEAGVGPCAAGRAREPSARRPDVCHPVGVSIGFDPPPSTPDVPPF